MASARYRSGTSTTPSISSLLWLLLSLPRVGRLIAKDAIEPGTDVDEAANASLPTCFSDCKASPSLSPWSFLCSSEEVSFRGIC